jgi:ParB family chromosome partitioning protein
MGMNATLQNLLLDRIRPSPYQARQDFDERTIDDLACSIEKSGLSQPILVRPIAPDAEGPLYELVSGELRLRASRKLGRPRIWAIAEPMTDEEAALRGMLENIKRQDINVMERARGYKTLTEPPFSLTMEEVATRMGFKDNSTVSRIVDLLNQPPVIQNLLARASISERHVRYLNKIKDLRKRIRWANVISKKGLSVQETEKRLNRTLERDRQKKGKEASSASVPAAEVDISGFRFRLEGDELVIGGRNFKLRRDVPQQFVEDFRGALDVAIRDLWVSKHPEVLAEAEAWKNATAETAEPEAGPQPDRAAPKDEASQEQLGEAIAGALEHLLGGEGGGAADLSKLLGFLGGKKGPTS